MEYRGDMIYIDGKGEKEGECRISLCEKIVGKERGYDGKSKRTPNLA